MSQEYPWFGAPLEPSGGGQTEKVPLFNFDRTEFFVGKHDWFNNTHQFLTSVSSCAGFRVGRYNGYTTQRVDPLSRFLNKKLRFRQNSSSSSLASLCLLQLLLQLSDCLLVTRNCGDRRTRTNACSKRYQGRTLQHGPLSVNPRYWCCFGFRQEVYPPKV